MKKRDLSRAISHALRHEPWLYELELDEGGWTNVSALLEGLRRQTPDWEGLSEEDLEKLVRSSAKHRNEIVNGRIRALYGHSVPVNLKKTHAAPGAALFHGTAREALPDISRDGLRPMGRRFVHLSTDPDTALAVGRRKSLYPIVLRIKAREAAQAGIQFYVGNEKVWLADFVPVQFIDFNG